MGQLGHSSTGRVQITSHGPFTVGTIVWRDARGALACTIIAKATYELDPGECSLLKDPLPLQEDDEPWDGDPTRSIRVPSDLAPFKSAAEVVVVGSAFAPTERPVQSVTARVVVGSVDKAIEAWTPRHFRRDGSIEGAATQTRFSLRYEHAAGGPDTDNPVGVEIGRHDGWGRIPLPLLLPPFHKLDAPDDFIPPVGFGPIAPTWRSRTMYLGEQDRAWLRRPGELPCPPSFPAKYFQAAPVDQWLDRPLAANERIVLEGLHAEIPRLVTNLPAIEPRAIVIDANHEPLRLQGDLLYVDTDRAIATLTFRGQIALDEGAGSVLVIVAGVPMGMELSPEAVRQILASDEAMRLKGPRNASPQAAPPGSGDGPSESDLETATEDIFEVDELSGETRVAESEAPAREALPFTTPPPALRPFQSSYPGSGLPFRGAQAPEPPLRAPTPAAPPPVPEPIAPPALVPPAAAPPLPAPPAVVLSPVIASPPPLSASPAKSAPAIAPAIAPSPTWSPWQAGARGPSSTPSAPAPEPPASSLETTLRSRRAGEPSRSFDAAFGSARGASDAAAQNEIVAEGSRREGAGRMSGQLLRRHAVVDLLFFDPKIAPRLRTMARFAEVFSQASRPRVTQAADAPRVEEPPRERMDVLRVLSCGRVAEPGEIRRALADSLEDLTDFDVPLVLVAGELRPTFDEVEMLRAMVAVVQPVAGPDKKLVATLALAQEALAASSPPRADVAVGLCRQIEQGSAQLSLPPRYVASHAERLLLEERKWKRRPILGAPRVRAELAIPGAGDPMLIYLPDSPSASLPLLPAWPALALCEIRPREDVAEALPEALLAVALGRVLHSRSEG